MTMHYFWAQNGPFALKNFFGNTIDIIFMFLLTPFIVQTLKKMIECIQNKYP